MALFDNSDFYSIYEYSKKLIGKSLSEIIPNEIEEMKGKGKLGQLVEKYFFGYAPNSRSEADFAQAGLELKCTPLKKLSDGHYHIKERLVCSMINYDEEQDVNKPFTQSDIYKKCRLMLLLFYLHISGVDVIDLKFIYSVLWSLPEKDLLIIEQDYKKIVEKISTGHAHELSEGDTTYLGACRKGQKGDPDVNYKLKNGSIPPPAPKRAFSLKTQYMRTILKYAEEHNTHGAVSNVSQFVNKRNEKKTSELVSIDELRERDFETIILDRFTPYYGMNYRQICKALGAKEHPTAKNKYAILSNDIITEDKTRGTNSEKTEEFIKSGIIMKTIRVSRSGKLAEAMSFENINYNEIVDEDWFSSRLYELFTSQFLMVVYKQDDNDDDVYTLVKAFFWTMPQKDLDDAARFWSNIKENVIESHIEPKYFYRESDGMKFHVRPKGKDAQDKVLAPDGQLHKKYCFWFNKNYVKEILSEKKLI